MMLEQISWLVDGISSFVEIMIVYSMVGMFTNIQVLKEKKKWIALLSLAYALILCGIHHITMFSSLSFLNALILLAGILILYHTHVAATLVLSISCLAVMAGLDFLVGYFICYEMQIPLEAVLEEHTIYRIMVIVISKVLLILMLFLIYMLLGKTRTFPLKYVLLLGGGMLAVFGMVWIGFSVMQSLRAEELQIFPLLFFLLSLLFMVFIVYFLGKIMQHYEEREKFTLIQKRSDMFEHSMEDQRKTFEQWRTSIHDYRNTIHAIYLLAKKGDLDGLQTYLEGEEQLMRREMFCYRTGAKCADVIISSKEAVAHQEGIPFQAKVQVPLNCDYIEEIHMAALLGNLLDNALESSRDEPDPSITLQMENRGRMLFLRITNTCTRKQNFRQTMKRETLLHGVGLNSVRAIVRRYNGVFKIVQEQNTVVAVVMLPDGTTDPKEMRLDKYETYSN